VARRAEGYAVVSLVCSLFVLCVLCGLIRPRFNASTTSMTYRTLILRSLRFHARAHLGVILGVAVGSAALIGALAVGDSVRGSLRELALQRLGNIHYAMAPQDRFF